MSRRIRFSGRAPAALRVILLALLAWLLVRPPAGGPGDQAVVLLPEVSAPDGLSPLAAALVRDSLRLVVRTSTSTPDPAELDGLAALAATAPLLAALPSAGPRLHARPPLRPRAGRAAAIHVSLTGVPGDSALIRVGDAAGPLDSGLVVIGADGGARAGFRVRPATPGWHEWEIEAAGERVTVGAWARSARPPHVLIAAGPASWETRFAAWALEEAGARITLAQPLGRGLALADAPAAIPADPAGLDPYDAVLVMAGAAVDASQAAALVEYVERIGGGVLAAGANAALLGADGADLLDPADARADAIEWTLPPELAALGPVDLTVQTSPLPRPAPGAAVAARVDGRTIIALHARGRGRAASLGISETWRWRLEAGRADEHREFWRSLVDWLAAGMRRTSRLRPEPGIAAPGTVVRVAADGAGPVLLDRPDGRREPLAVDRGRALFLADEPGIYAFGPGEPSAVREAERTEDERSLAGDEGPQPVSVAPSGFAARAGFRPADAWARLALLASASGGAALAPDSLESRVAAMTAASAGDGSGIPPAAPFAALILLAATEWTVRRLRGRP